ncbi:hypothetical protein B0H16DRAFT_1471234 [Mycena metata]|uniref:Uncharacterized protein n=1 Tax=Mycena metata TaxID=1033252 RepID=A0AAD7MPV9_9AGAR|nr:hypothetical protein B0H16DRAFT_1471234 [Mycena metata]
MQINAVLMQFLVGNVDAKLDAVQCTVVQQIKLLVEDEGRALARKWLQLHPCSIHATSAKALRLRFDYFAEGSTPTHHHQSILQRTESQFLLWFKQFARKLATYPNLSMTFIEEPLGVPADQGYGFPQVDFGQCIGPNGEFEIIRKLGWRPNVNHMPSSKASILLIVPAAFSQKCSIRRSQDTDRTGDKALGSELLGRDAGHDVYNAGYGMAGPTAALHAFVTFTIAFRSPRQGTEGLPSSLLGHGRLDRLILRDTLRGLSQMHASRVLHTELDRPPSEQHYVQCSEPDNRGQFALEYRIDPGSSPPLNKPILPTIEQSLSGSFMIGDFGGRYKTVKFDEVRGMPESSPVLAPEVYELLLGVPLFSRRQDMAPADADRDQLAQLRALTGDAFPADFEILPDVLDAHPPAHSTLLLREKARALKIPEHDIAGATDLISQCLRIDLAASPTALELLNQSRWLAELGGDPWVDPAKKHRGRIRVVFESA